ncbi:MAG: carboxymuconolactone decarboxylase family protein [Spirochaetia bacterium]
MAFIKTVPADRAVGKLLDIYQDDQKTKGYVANHTSAFSLRPEVYQAWRTLLNSIRSNMRLRRFELVTFAAARALNCTYCMLAHGSILRKNFFGPSELAAIARDFRSAGLPEEEVMLMEFAQRVTLEPNQITARDFDLLREKGLSDEEILDVVLTVTARNFMSKTLDALGAEPDDAFLELEPELREALVIGRPFPTPTRA